MSRHLSRAIKIQPLLDKCRAELYDAFGELLSVKGGSIDVSAFQPPLMVGFLRVSSVRLADGVSRVPVFATDGGDEFASDVSADELLSVFKKIAAAEAANRFGHPA